VPKAPVDEDGQSQARKYEIRQAGQREAPSPSDDPGSLEMKEKAVLGRLVATATNARHDRRATSFCEYVCH